ncbi:MAG: transporter [Bacteroidota bacterium]
MQDKSHKSQLRSGVLISYLILVNNFIYAQEAISTERPSFSNSSSVLLPGRLNVESGFQFQRVDDATDELVLNTTQLRYGVNEHFELRFTWNLLQRDTQVEGANLSGTGWAPPVLGIKTQLLEGDGWIPETALIAEVALRGGSDIFSNDRLVPALRYSMGWSVGARGALTHTYNIFWALEDDRALNLLTLIYAHGITDDLTAFVELYSFLVKGESDYRTDMGLIYLIKPRFQVDLSGGLGLSDISPDWFLDVGLSFAIFK